MIRIVAGALDNNDLENPTIVDSNETSSPKENFKFGNYSFTIKVKDHNGSVVDGYRFAKPVLLSMFYDVSGLADRVSGGVTQDDDSFTPKMTFFNTRTQRWENVVNTCTGKDRYEYVDYKLQMQYCNLYLNAQL